MPVATRLSPKINTNKPKSSILKVFRGSYEFRDEQRLRRNSVGVRVNRFDKDTFNTWDKSVGLEVVSLALWWTELKYSWWGVSLCLFSDNVMGVLGAIINSKGETSFTYFGLRAPALSRSADERPSINYHLPKGHSHITPYHITI